MIRRCIGWSTAKRRRGAGFAESDGRFETQWLAAPKNFAALADPSGQWIDLVHGRRPPVASCSLRMLARPRDRITGRMRSRADHLVNARGPLRFAPAHPKSAAILDRCTGPQPAANG